MAPDTLTGRTIGSYHLLRRLGRGGMATVYLAVDQRLQREVAFKVLHGIDALDETFGAVNGLKPCVLSCYNGCVTVHNRPGELREAATGPRAWQRFSEFP